jgi:5-methylcytosine-specific restriction endonuclease McrA
MTDVGCEGAQTSRYLPGRMIEGDARYRPFPKGQCQWCGKELPRRCKSYCPANLIETYAGSGKFYGWSECWAAFYDYWYRRPRFQRLILLRDNFTCQRCGAQPTVTDQAGITRPDLHGLHVDHILPFSKGGPTILENLQLLCVACNLSKGNHD